MLSAMIVQHRHRNRPDHPARGLPPAARGGQRELPARVGGERTARAPLVRRLRFAARRASRRRRPAARRWSATSATTTRPSSSRRCRCRTQGRDLPESRFVVADTLVRFDHVLGMAEVLCGSPDEVGGPPGRRHARAADRRRARRARPVASRPPSTTSRRSTARSAQIRRGRRVPDRRLAAGRAPDVGERARPLPLAPPRQPLAVPLPARAGRARTGRLLTRDPGEVRGQGRQPQPDRRHDAPRRG